MPRSYLLPEQVRVLSRRWGMWRWWPSHLAGRQVPCHLKRPPQTSTRIPARMRHPCRPQFEEWAAWAQRDGPPCAKRWWGGPCRARGGRSSPEQAAPVWVLKTHAHRGKGAAA